MASVRGHDVCFVVQVCGMGPWGLGVNDDASKAVEGTA